MKTRTGFVSNSSSSSFILIAAAVKDHEKAKAFLGSVLDVADNHCDYVKIMKAAEVTHRCGAKFSNGTMEVENFQTSVHVKGLKDDDLVLVAEVTNNEGDMGAFEYDDEAGEIDYDIDLDDLPSKWQKELYEGVIEENGFERIDKCFGAARNG